MTILTIYSISVKKLATNIFQLNLFTTEYTFKSSTIIRDVNVIVTILTNESLKKAIHQNMMTPPWNILCHTHIRNVLNDKDLPFCKVLYRGG